MELERIREQVRKKRESCWEKERKRESILKRKRWKERIGKDIEMYAFCLLH